MSMIVLTLYSLAAQGVQATRIPAIERDSPTSPCNDLQNCRTTWNIVWSCLATVLSCTWVAVHPNIPGPDETWIQVTSRRIKLTLLALVAPELIILWAMRQWWAAREIAKRYQEYGWTRTHGFFAIMGGFMLFEGGDAVQVLYPHELEEYLKRGDIDITEEEIQDRSKGDILSKGFVLVQTGWFVIQCIARGVEHLPLTELELVTLAFATLNFITYTLWWKKPLSMDCPYPVSRKRSGRKRDDATRGTVWSMFKDKITGVNKSMAAIGSALPIIILNMPRTIWNAILSAFGTFSRNFIIDQVSNSLFISGEWHETLRVPTFYSGRLETTPYDILVFLAVFVASLFGSIHCIAWSFEFPSQTNRMLWRISSVVITCYPAYYLGIMAILIGHFVLPSWSYILLRPFNVLGLISYIIARVSLLVLAFISLRLLPDGAYQTVHWTSFIPHI